jgi:hypothetical protein
MLHKKRWKSTETASALDAGHHTMKLFRKNLDKFDENGSSRHFFQLKMHDLYLSRCCELVYGKTVMQANKLDIMRVNKWSDVGLGACVVAPRRWGKSEAAAMFTACYVYTLPRTRVVILAASLRQAGNSDGLLKPIRRYLQNVFGIKKFAKNDGDHLNFKIGDDMREIIALPATAIGYVTY